MVLKKVGYVLLCVCILIFGAAFITFPERYAECCFKGFALWAECVLPSLFPFMVLSMLLIKTGLAEKASLPLKRMTNALNLPQSAAVLFIISVLSGYPAGSRMLKEFYDGGAVSGEDCQKLAPLCSTSGPLFIIGSVGYKMFRDKQLGIKIFLAHAVSVIAVELIYCRFFKKSGSLPQKPTKSGGNILYDTFYGAVISVAVAGGFIAFFYVVAQFLADFNIFYPLEKLFGLFLEEKTAKALCLGLAEVTTGCSFLAQSGANLKGALAGFMITFGGVSILLQQLCYLVGAGVRPFKFIAVKFIQAALCFCILLLIQ